MGRSAQAIGRSRGGWTTKVHAFTGVIGRPYALMLTPGNVSDMTAAPALLERAGRMSYLLGDKGYDADGSASSFAILVPRLSSPAAATASAPSATTSSATPAAISSKTPSVDSRTSAASTPATRYDKLAANFLSAVAHATAVAFWL